MRRPSNRRVQVMALLGVTVVLAAGCSKSEGTTSSTASGGSSAGAQVVDTPTAGASGEGCTLDKAGVKKADFKGLKVGFSQSEKEANPFRIAETQSIKDEAAKRGMTLEVTNAQSQLPKQIADIQDLLAKGVQLLIVAPLNSDGLDPALKAAHDKGVPVITIDRKVNSPVCTNYVTFIGSNFVQQGQRAAQQLAKATGGTADVAILLGSSGNNVTDDRTSGFVDEIAKSSPNIKIGPKQSGEFARDKGQQVMEQLLQSNPEINAVYAENDEMGIGAVQAIKDAGKKPGTDIKIVSIDGTKNAVTLITTGEYNGVVESNPRFGPLAFSTAEKFFKGDSIPANVIIQDKQYDSTNAGAEVNNAY